VAELQPVPRGFLDPQNPTYIENRQWLENLRNLVNDIPGGLDQIQINVDNIAENEANITINTNNIASLQAQVDGIIPPNPPVIQDANPATYTNYQLSELTNQILDALRDAGLVAP